METLKTLLAFGAAITVISVLGAIFDWARTPRLGDGCVYRTRDFDRPRFLNTKKTDKSPRTPNQRAAGPNK